VPVRDADEAMYDPKSIKYTGPGSPSCHLKRNETKERQWSRKRTPAAAKKVWGWQQTPYVHGRWAARAVVRGGRGGGGRGCRRVRLVMEVMEAEAEACDPSVVVGLGSQNQGPAVAEVRLRGRWCRPFGVKAMLNTWCLFKSTPNRNIRTKETGDSEARTQ